MQGVIIKDYEYLHFCLNLLVCCGIGLKLIGLSVLCADCQKVDNVHFVNVDCMSELSESTEYSILLFLHPFVFDYFMPVYRSVPEISDKRRSVIQALYTATWLFVFLFFGLAICLGMFFERHFPVVTLAPLLVLLITYIENINSVVVHTTTSTSASTGINISQRSISRQRNFSLQKCATKLVETVASNLLHDIKTPLQCIVLQVRHFYSYSVFSDITLSKPLLLFVVHTLYVLHAAYSPGDSAKYEQFRYP